ncbi:MAG TPA: hypothetical protein VKZ67_01295 [Natronosporangium sp.]|nr:hypothetical protein [Natronosporangium sp.]
MAESADRSPRRQEHPVFRGVAPVPQPGRPRFTDTADLPVVEPAPPERVSASRPVLPFTPPPGMVVRRRWRYVRRGSGWTWAGVIVLVICWGIWAIPLRGGDVLGPLLGLGVVLATGLLLFVLARLLGRAVFERALGRERHTAWPSHLTVGTFFTLAGVTFLQQTYWIRDTWQWVTGADEWADQAWRWLVDLWPM